MIKQEVFNLIETAKHNYILGNIINPKGIYHLTDIIIFKQEHLQQFKSEYGYDPTEGMCLYYKQHIAYLKLHQNDTVVINDKEKTKMSIILDNINNNNDYDINAEDIAEIAQMARCSTLCEQEGDTGWITEELVKEIYNGCKGVSPKKIVQELYDKFTTMAPTSILAFTTEDDSHVALKNIDDREFITNVHSVIAVDDIIIDPVLGYGPVSISSYVEKMLMVDEMGIDHEESNIGDNIIYIVEALMQE